MSTNRRTPGVRLAGLSAIMALLSSAPRGTTAAPGSERWFTDRPVAWEEHDDADVATPPEVNHLQMLEAALTIRDSTASEADRLLALAGATAAEDVNALDEVPCSTWYCARHHLHPMPLAALAAGPPLQPPRLPLTVMKGKDMGSASGFQVKDAGGNRYMLNHTLGAFDHDPTAARSCVPIGRPGPGTAYRVVALTARVAGGAGRPDVPDARTSRVHLRWRPAAGGFAVVGLDRDE